MFQILFTIIFLIYKVALYFLKQENKFFNTEKYKTLKTRHIHQQITLKGDANFISDLKKITPKGEKKLIYKIYFRTSISFN